MVGTELGTTVDEQHGVVPDVDDACISIVEETVSVDEGGVGKLDDDIFKGGKTILLGVVVR